MLCLDKWQKELDEENETKITFRSKRNVSFLFAIIRIDANCTLLVQIPYKNLVY